MANTTITFRTDEKLKKEATKLFESMGMSLSTALNMFMRQSVIKQKYPCSIETEIANDYAHTYPKEFFELFGSCVDDSIKEPKELYFRNDNRREKV